VSSLHLAFRHATQQGYRGYDPYDALLSPLARWPLLGDSRLFRLAFTQAVKRFPLNLRPLLGIKSGINPKALALFLSAAARAGEGSGLRQHVEPLAAALEGARSSFGTGMSWGYNFPWQGRAFFLPAGTPTVVVTSFAGEAFLDAHVVTGEGRFLANALEACTFVLGGLNRTEDPSGACLSYSPLDRSVVYNASLLGARLLVLTGQLSGKKELIEAAAPLVRFALAKQQAEGGWAYGSAGFQQWMDSFHTGFVLGALDVYCRATGDGPTERAVGKGAAHFARAFFGPGGEPYFAPGKAYPRDIHSAAQGILTFLQLRDVDPRFEELAAAVGRWMLYNLFDQNGGFYYQVRRTHTGRISFMRWSQAWGVRALAELARCGVEL
jgi:hypothetical protein